MEYVSEIISGVFALIITAIEIRSSKDRKRVEQRAAVRAREARLAMKMQDANLELSFATALAVEQHQLNGEMKEAKRKAAAAQEEYNSFIQELAAEQTTAI